MSDSLETRAREAALSAMERAYAPYSQYPVGAALAARSGRIYAGCNVENASYGATMCAERAAVSAAVAAGDLEVELLCIATDGHEPASPCGVCRQVLVEFAPQLAIVSVTRRGQERRWSLSDLLPDPFTPSSLVRP